jgi:hypothetical protein
MTFRLIKKSRNISTGEKAVNRLLTQKKKRLPESGSL